MRGCKHRIAVFSILIASTYSCVKASASKDQVRVFVAASAAHAVEKALEKASIGSVQLNTAASSILAHQIDRGAPADIFISADQAWVRWLVDRHRLDTKTLRPLVANQLVVVSKDKHQTWPPDTRGKAILASGDPTHVPLGRYAQEALTELGLWTQLSSKLITGKDARAVLFLAERGEVDQAIVYKTDAQSSHEVFVLAELPRSKTHPIIYPIVVTKGANRPTVTKVYDALVRAQAVYRQFGFVSP
jgi:molybdate transport system substrate-binding protein